MLAGAVHMAVPLPLCCAFTPPMAHAAPLNVHDSRMTHQRIKGLVRELLACSAPGPGTLGPGNTFQKRSVSSPAPVTMV
jgi:hypothetical protein